MSILVKRIDRNKNPWSCSFRENRSKKCFCLPLDVRFFNICGNAQPMREKEAKCNDDLRFSRALDQWHGFVLRHDWIGLFHCQSPSVLTSQSSFKRRTYKEVHYKYVKIIYRPVFDVI